MYAGGIIAEANINKEKQNKKQEIDLYKISQ